MDDPLDTATTASSNEAASRPPTSSAAPRTGIVAPVVALLALGLAGFALWRTETAEHGRTAADNGIEARLDDLSRGLDQRKRELETLRARVGDADNVNKSVREELLGLGERSRHLEDAVANLAEQRLTGRDALAMNEAEFLLQQAQERLELFHDTAAATTAYRLADSALAAAEDPMFASVRQTIGAELQMLAASPSVDTRGALATLERIRDDLPKLPLPHTQVAGTEPPSRWQAFLSQFVRISHTDDVDALHERDIGLVRSLVTLDLRSAEAALLARDEGAWRTALGRARAGIASAFDAQAEAAKAALADLDRLVALPLAPAAPELGSALKELRNLRATRSLAQPAASKSDAATSKPAAAPVQHEGDA